MAVAFSECGVCCFAECSTLCSVRSTHQVLKWRRQHARLNLDQARKICGQFGIVTLHSNTLSRYLDL